MLTHWDFFDNGVNPNMRYLTLLIYLNEPEARRAKEKPGAGGTSFRKAFGGKAKA